MLCWPIGFSAAAQRAMSKREIVNYPYQLLASRMDRVTYIFIRLHVETEDIRRCYQYSDLKLLIGNSKQVGRPCLQIRRSDGAFLCLVHFFLTLCCWTSRGWEQTSQFPVEQFYFLSQRPPDDENILLYK